MNRRVCALLAAWCMVVLVAVNLGGCGQGTTQERLVKRLTTLKGYHPPESVGTDSAGMFPTLYVRAQNDTARAQSDTAVVGIVNRDPLDKPDRSDEKGLRDIAANLRTTLTAMRGKDSTAVRPDINVVADRSMTFGQVVQSVYGCNNAGFWMQHLVTAKGAGHRLVPPPGFEPSFGPIGWDMWIWWFPGDTLLWVPRPDDSTRFSPLHVVPPQQGGADFTTLAGQLHRTLDSLSYVHPGPGRLVGVSGYPELAYREFIRLLDALHNPAMGAKLAGATTILAPSDGLILLQNIQQWQIRQRQGQALVE